jgi:hypothetical protein
MIRRVAALFVLTLVVAACGDTVTQPQVGDDLLSTAMSPAENGGNGNGATFTFNPYVGIGHGENEGTKYCEVLNYEYGPDDPNDWMRIAKDGGQYLHIQDAVATIRIWNDVANWFLPPDFEGEGRWSVNWHFGELALRTGCREHLPSPRNRVRRNRRIQGPLQLGRKQERQQHDDHDQVTCPV